MCGIVGVAGNIDNVDVSSFEDMLYMDVVRGEDSTGVLVVEPNDFTTLYKSLGTPSNFFDVSKGKHFYTNFRGFNTVPKKVLLGHNRKATVGAVDLEGAHPFRYEHIIGVHNGTLDWYEDLHPTETHDSRALLSAVNDKGIDFAWYNLYGHAALVWWDKRDSTINFIRNKERTFYILEGGGCIYWASEPWMITSALDRNKITLYDSKKEKISPVPTEVNKHYKYKVTASGVEKIFEKDVVENPYGNSYSNNNWGGYAFTSHYGYDNSNNVSPLKLVKNFNKGWAKDQDRADKEEFVGLDIKPSFTCSIKNHEGKDLKGLACRDQNLFRKVFVFSNNKDHQDKLGRLTVGGKISKITINSRPRILSYQQDMNHSVRKLDDDTVYGVSLDNCTVYDLDNRVVKFSYKKGKVKKKKFSLLKSLKMKMSA